MDLWAVEGERKAGRVAGHRLEVKETGFSLEGSALERFIRK